MYEIKNTLKMESVWLCEVSVKCVHMSVQGVL